MAKVLSEFGTLVPATADGEKADKSSVDAIVNVYGSKNLLPYPYRDTTKTENGITFTDNGDGTITVNGTASATTVFYCADPFNVPLKKGTYTISANGVTSKYGIYFRVKISGNLVYDAILYNDTNITLPDDGMIYYAIYIYSGATFPAGGFTFKPMIRDARITDDTFVPYAMTNRELTQEKLKNNFGTLVSLASSVAYSAPCDGYIELRAGNAGGSNLTVSGSNGINARGLILLQTANERTALFVKKGSIITPYLSNADATATFIPFE